MNKDQLKSWVNRVGMKNSTKGNTIVMDVSSEVKNDLYFANGYTQKSTSSKDRGITFNLTFNQYRELSSADICAYTGNKLSNNNRTLERINPNVGYTPENTIPVTSDANNHKAQLDCFVKRDTIPLPMKIKLMRKALYQMEKELKCYQKNLKNSA